jgi:hypothetical protein
MIILIGTLVIDISIVKVYDLIDKSFISQQTKLFLFSLNTGLCLLLQFIILNYLQRIFTRRGLNKTLNIRTLYRISFIALFIIASLLGIVVFQEFSYHSYKKLISMLIILIAYGTAAGLIIRLASLFICWYRSSHNWIIFLYFSSMLFIAFNLLTTAIITCVKLVDRPDEIKEFFGGTVDISAGKYVLLDNIYTASSIMSFVSIWITTALLMNYYREKLINAVANWIILSIPLLYFLVNYFYQLILSTILFKYLANDPITISIVLTTFLSLSKPIGGFTFAIVFWNISRIIAYEKNIRTSMIISGWGILLLFGANQALVQTLTPHPPFGLATLTVLILASFLMLLGIYNSAALVSVNNNLRKSIHKHALESKLLGLIGQAEMGNVIEKTVYKITQRKDSLEKDLEQPIELDEMELKKYVDFVIREVRKEPDK